MKWKMKEIPLLVFLVVYCVGFSSSRIIRIGERRKLGVVEGKPLKIGLEN